jgi:hypothetical protein
MNCRSVRRRLSEHLDGELPAPEQAAIAAHLEVCAGCRDELEAFRRAGEALKTLSAVEVAPDLTSDLRRRLAAPAARRFRVGWVGAAVVAVGLAIGCLLWLSPRAPSPGPPPARTDVAAPQVVIEPAEPVVPLTEDLPEAETPKEPYRAPVQIVSNQDEAELAGHLDEERRERPEEEMALVSAEDTPAAPTDVEGPRRAVSRRPGTEYGVILLLGPPEPILPSSRCYLEVSFPDGAKSIVDQSVERDAGGQPRVVQLSYQQVSPKTESLNQGG